MALSDYVISPPAKKDIEDILNYIAFALSNKSAANRFYNQLLAKLDIIRLYPESCQIVDNKSFEENEIRSIMVSNYRLLYKFEKNKNTIIVLRIIHAKRKMNIMLKSL